MTAEPHPVRNRTEGAPHYGVGERAGRQRCRDVYSVSYEVHERRPIHLSSIRASAAHPPCHIASSSPAEESHKSHSEHPRHQVPELGGGAGVETRDGAQARIEGPSTIAAARHAHAHTQQAQQQHAGMLDPNSTADTCYSPRCARRPRPLVPAFPMSQCGAPVADFQGAALD